MNAILLICAIITLLAAHIVRTMRQVQLMRNQIAIDRRFDFLMGLSIGYAYNTFLPFRIGEIIRIFYISSRSKIQISQVAGAIIAERVSDLIVVALLLPLVTYLANGNIDIDTIKLSSIFAAIAILIIIGAILIGNSKSIRRIAWDFANIFNEKIAIELVNTIWTSSDLIRRNLLLPNYILSTIAMWSGYFLSYYIFALAMNFTTLEVIRELVGAPMRSLARDLDSNSNIAYMLFTFIPVLLVLVYGSIKDWKWLISIVRLGVPRIYTSNSTALIGSFREFADYGLFLKSHFTSARPLIADFGLYGLQEATIQRILPGGSDALTAVVETNETFGIRKFAIGDAANKLAVQAKWLNDNKQNLTLCEVIAENQAQNIFSFDMPYSPFTRDFYEYIHTASRVECLKMLRNITNEVANFHTKFLFENNSDATIEEYLTQKAIKNAKIIIDFTTQNLNNEFYINGVKFTISELYKLTNIAWLTKQISYKKQTIIHGDLTIENIIIAPETNSGWYIIDPNPENIFNCELIDWAKMLQSLHLGYEWLNRAGSTKIINGDIMFAASRSEVYGELYNEFVGFLKSRYDTKIVREIYFHEIINYLRLIPYKIRHAPEMALNFISALLILLREYESDNDC